MITKELLEELLNDGDLRSIGPSRNLIPLIEGRQSFDDLFEFLFHKNRLIVMRAADVVEKISLEHREYLKPHKAHILSLLKTAKEKELKWHLAQLISRVELNEDEIGKVWEILTCWSIDSKESRIVRTNAIHALFNLLAQYPELKQDFMLTVRHIEKENIPSINARLRILKVLKRDPK